MNDVKQIQLCKYSRLSTNKKCARSNSSFLYSHAQVSSMFRTCSSIDSYCGSIKVDDPFSFPKAEPPRNIYSSIISTKSGPSVSDPKVDSPLY